MIDLTSAEEPAARLVTGSESVQFLTGTETVLLVDDVPPLRRLVRTFLERHGYTVLEARTSAEAARIANSYRGCIHLLLTDIMMPQVGGYELSNYLRFHRVDMKVLYMSGYGQVVPGHGQVQRDSQVLAKPFGKDALLLAVRQTLDETPELNAGIVSKAPAQFTTTLRLN
jgi:two-component system, cell cycle sensor histidine kinase and response regulator CckA